MRARPDRRLVAGFEAAVNPKNPSSELSALNRRKPAVAVSLSVKSYEISPNMALSTSMRFLRRQPDRIVERRTS